MSLARRVASLVHERLSREDLISVVVFYPAVLLLVLALTWQGIGGLAGVWTPLAHTRGIVLALLGLGYGVGLGDETIPVQRSTAVALVIIALLALPVELAALAASYAPVPLGWVLVLPPLTVLGFLAVGRLLGALLARLRLRALAPVMVPAVLAGTFFLDISLGRNLLSPFHAALAPSLPHPAILILASLGLLLSWGRGESG